MTFGELIEHIRDTSEPGDDWPIQSMLAVVGVWRTWNQNEASTFEGDIAGLQGGFVNRFGKPTEESVKRFMIECPNIMAIKFPDWAMKTWIGANDDEKDCDLDDPQAYLDYGPGGDALPPF